MTRSIINWAIWFFNTPRGIVAFVGTTVALDIVVYIATFFYMKRKAKDARNDKK